MIVNRKLTSVAAFLLVSLSASAFAIPPVMQRKLPGNSIYQLDLHLVDQGGRSLELRSLRGKPVLVAMFYTSCKFACPLIIEQVKWTERALSEADRKRIRVLLVSFDPARDTPEALKTAGEEHHVDLSRWTLARTDPTGVRKLAAILGVQYRAMTNGDFNHSTLVTLIDADGRIVAKSDQTNQLDTELVAAAARALHAPNTDL